MADKSGERERIAAAERAAQERLAHAVAKVTAETRPLGQIWEDKAQQNKGKIFLLFEDQRISYDFFNERVNRVANALRNLGVRRGDKVAAMLPNVPEMLYTLFAVVKIGAVLVPVNTALKGDGLAYIIGQSDSVLLIVSQGWADRINFVRNQLGGLQSIVLENDGKPADVGAIAGARDFRSLLEASPHYPAAQTTLADVAEIIYTSGTTGVPKGVLWAQSNLVSSGLLFSALCDYTSEDILYTGLPLYHGAAQALTVMAAFAADATVALSRRFSASRFWDEVRECGATAINHIGAIIPILCKQPERPDDADNPVRISLGPGAPKELWDYFERRFGLQIVEYYGSTEGGGTMNVPGGKPGSVGRPMPTNEVRLVDDQFHDVPPGVPGEFVSRPNGGTLGFAGYYKMPEATAEKFKGDWLCSGDYLYRDEEGYFYFVDRKKDSMRRRGENISPYEVEKVVNSHPAVLESAAVAAPSEVSEDEVKIVVVLKPGAALKPEDLIAHCDERMAYYMVPRFVEFRGELPKTGTEKVQRGILKAEGLKPGTWDREAAGYKLKR